MDEFSCNSYIEFSNDEISITRYNDDDIIITLQDNDKLDIDVFITLSELNDIVEKLNLWKKDTL